MSDVSMGAVRMGGAVSESVLSVGGGIRVGGLSVSGNVDVGSGGSSPVTEARWGSIEGDILDQSDLMEMLSELGTAVATKASANDLNQLSLTVATKMTTPTGTNGQILSLVNGVWTAVDLPTYEGGVS